MPALVAIASSCNALFYSLRHTPSTRHNPVSTSRAQKHSPSFVSPCRSHPWTTLPYLSRLISLALGNIYLRFLSQPCAQRLLFPSYSLCAQSPAFLGTVTTHSCLSDSFLSFRIEVLIHVPSYRRSMSGQETPHWLPYIVNEGFVTLLPPVQVDLLRRPVRKVRSILTYSTVMPS